MKKAAIYMRVSTQNQEDEETIQSQKSELLKRVKEDDALLSSDCIYEDDGWTGATLEREGLDNLRSEAKDKKINVVYIYDRGRIARPYFLQEVVIRELADIGIETISLHDINATNPTENVMAGMMGLFHEYERVKIAERMRLGKLRKVRDNKKLLGYQPKYGYDYHLRIKSGPDARDGHFTINKKQAKVVHQIYEWAESGMSKYAIRDELYRQNILPAKAKRDQWCTSVIDRLLRDTTYMGIHYYNKSESVVTKSPRKEIKYRRTTKGSRIARPQSEWFQMEVPAIVSPELFKKVQEQLLRNKRTSRRNNNKNNYLVGGVLECICGYARTGDPTKHNLYYRCCDRLNNACGTRKCHEKGVNATVLDTLVWNNIKNLLTQPELVFEQAKRWQEGASPLLARLDGLKGRLVGFAESEGRYAKMYGEGVMPEQIYKDNISLLNEGRSKVLAEISGLEDELSNKPSIPLEKLVDGVLKLVEDLDFSKKKQIIQKVVTKVVATKKEVTVWGHIPVLATEKVGLDVKYRDCWSAECREIDAF